MTNCRATLYERKTPNKALKQQAESSGNEAPTQCPSTGEKGFQLPNHNSCCHCAQSIPSRQSSRALTVMKMSLSHHPIQEIDTEIDTGKNIGEAGGDS